GHDRPKIRCPECGVLCPVPVGRDTPDAPRRPAERPAQPAGPACPRCGAPTSAPSVPCPDCAAADAWAAPATAPPRPARDDAEAGSPSAVRPGDEERRCPACGRLLDEADVVCPGCDFDLVKGRPAVRVWPRVETHWENGPSAQTRWRLFVGGAGVALGLAALTALLSGSWFAS